MFEIIISGFGGQGALFAGQLLAYAGLDQDKQVTWIPSYGPEMRGGTAHCTVIVSDEPIGSPTVRRPRAVIALNQPSFEVYEPDIKPGGWMIYNSSLVTGRPARADIGYVAVPGNEIGEQLGSPRQANVACLGALVAASGILPLEALCTALDRRLPERQRKYLESNKAALRLGAAHAAVPASA